MRIDKLRIHSVPGLTGGLPALNLTPGLTLIVGPNASGKSTIARTLLAVLWPKEMPSDASADSHWSINGTAYEARLFARKVTWHPALDRGAPRGAAALARFGIRSLLEADDADDRNVAAELTQELSGGFDLAKAKAVFSTSPRYRNQSREARDLKEALQNLAQVERRSDALEQHEGRLASLEIEIEAAQAAQGAAEAAELLVEVLGTRATLNAFEEAEKNFPQALENLTGREVNELRELEIGLENATLELAEVEAEHAGHAQHSIELEGDHILPDLAVFETWEARIECLREIEREGRERREALHAAEAMLGTARTRLHAPNKQSDLSLDSAHLEGLGEAIREWRAALESRKATQHAAELWENWTKTTNEPDTKVLDTEGQLRALRAWLRSPEVSDPALSLIAPTRGVWPLAICALTLGVAGLLLAFIVPSETFELPGSIAFALLAMTGLVLLWVRSGKPQDMPSNLMLNSERETAMRAAEQAGLALDEWSTNTVELTLNELESQRETQRSAERLVERAKAQAAALAGELERVCANESKLRAALLTHAQAAGISEPWLDLGAAAQIEALVALGRAQSDEAAARARLLAHNVEQKAHLDAAAVWLHRFDRPAPADAAALSAEHTALTERRRKLARAKDLKHQAERSAKRLRRQVTEQAAKHAQLWQRTGLEPGSWATLETLMRQLEDWRTHNQTKRDTSGELANLRRRFREAGGYKQLVRLLPRDQEPEDVTPETAAKWATQEQVQADRLAELIDERGRIRNSLEEASKGQQLADTIAAVRAATEGIATERTAAATDAMARTLIQSVARQQQVDHTPQLLQRAQNYFGRFTQQAWRIELGSSQRGKPEPGQSAKLDSHQGFVAINVATGTEHSLDELSDGTRVQLLFAARLAALESREDNQHVPICLDEVLSTSDPRRFRAIATALFELANDGQAPRQVLYFTADMSEAEQWKLVARQLGRPEPKTIDLGRLRGEPADWSGELAPQPNVPEPLPEPTGKTPKEYAIELGVPSPDGFTEPANWHLFTLAFDDLPTLTTCLRWQLPTIGSWRAAHDASHLPPDVNDDSTHRFGLRLELANAVARLWRVGRGRPVTWSDIEASGAVSPAFDERIRTILTADYRDPRAFIQAASKLPRFKKQADKLREHLIDCGVLATEDPLEVGELQRRTLAATQQAAADLGIDKAVSYTRWVIQLLSQELGSGI